MNNSVVVFRGGSRGSSRGGRGGRSTRGKTNESSKLDLFKIDDIQNEFFKFMIEKRRLESERGEFEAEINPLNAENNTELFDKKLEKLEMIEEKMEKFVTKLNEKTFFRVIADITVLTSNFNFISSLYLQINYNFLRSFIENVCGIVFMGIYLFLIFDFMSNIKIFQ
jgi:hypothetical protein